jgi:hypothetical protein
VNDDQPFRVRVRLNPKEVWSLRAMGSRPKWAP